MLSASSKVKQAKRFQFLKDAKKQNLVVSHLLGEADWALTENHDKALAAIELQSQYGNSIHLDIEPHTLSSFQRDKTKILAQYIRLLEKVRERHPMLNLSVAIPHHWPEKTYKSLADYVDQVYFMAYGNNKLDIIAERTKNLLNSIAIDKLVLVFRQQEFANEIALEQIINDVMQSTGVFQFAVHKLDIYTQE
ncbi:hypothetical protein [Thalassotalea profundi]|uniref:GH18 domain-containing protein n=1 Tax=Thalassotalea profundi TaxID=2036687 RepID=A0ABQ3IM01_9GAMM|nr:hypothetical protein [Thalassotalea profundi]GHE88315.1 hypothetical protein GCM10011501_17150 [Thalassotalea profundi]